MERILQVQENREIGPQIEGEVQRLAATVLFSHLEEMVQQIPELLTSAYASPRFTQGDCWIDQIIMAQQNSSWYISAFPDMEVASAGDCISDLVSLCEGLAQALPSNLTLVEAPFRRVWPGT